ncbi:hypothetical protein HN018_25355 (plasmid) [Lichenicola cladoniae]|uniref:Uncharacterized protein n=1 Tax=Lichenicola cladoniae TaxID=1484109 RepID=A0A6M8HZB2_9PROT|nr:hypothetical protein [Acetobacteraceae bacterium]QKE93495.1 hypothetical protein HN018_25355 [Lichenicola cladoniae]
MKLRPGSETANIDTASAWGRESLTPSPIWFETIRVSVWLIANAPRETLESLVRYTTLWSPVANTIHSPVHLDVTPEPEATAVT